VKAWPELPLSAWEDTRDTLHMWTQIIGKVRLALEPPRNHWWQVPLYVTPRGLSTSAIPYGERSLEIEFDFRRHVLDVRTSDGHEGHVRLEPRTVADFYAETMACLAGLGMPVTIMARPVEVPEAIPFPDDTKHASYDPGYAHRFWRLLVQVQRVLTRFRGGFIGKVSPVHFFWGSFDLAVTRFSGRAAPLHPGLAPNVAPWVMQEAYSHEVSSAGYWTGGGAEGAFYSYAYPEPAGYPDWPVDPPGAFYGPDLGEFLLPYELVRTASDPDAVLLSFLQSTYRAAAELAGWDSVRLEAPGAGLTPSLDLPAADPGVDVNDVATGQHFEARSNGELVGRADYTLTGDFIIFTHTEVDPRFAGRGFGAALVRHSLDEARRMGLRVIPLCSFYQTWIERHPEYQGMVYQPPASRVPD
jgi:predicted GNAT family acetyltransferase